MVSEAMLSVKNRCSWE